jgi:protein-tyrosine phosphatase
MAVCQLRRHQARQAVSIRADAPAAVCTVRVTFVCMGNICRSPTAHGVFRHKVREAGLDGWVVVDSAGTHGHFHAGEPPDTRSQQHARARGYDLSDLRARALHAADFATSDLLLVMDWDNLALTEERCPPEHRHKLRRLTEFCLRYDSPVVPDPYYGGARGFDTVLDLIEDACEGLLAQVRQRVEARPDGAGRISSQNSH